MGCEGFRENRSSSPTESDTSGISSVSELSSISDLMVWACLVYFKYSWIVSLHLKYNVHEILNFIFSFCIHTICNHHQFQLYILSNICFSKYKYWWVNFEQMLGFGYFLLWNKVVLTVGRRGESLKLNFKLAICVKSLLYNCVVKINRLYCLSEFFFF